MPEGTQHPAVHAQQVEDLWAAFGCKENRRVPIAFACDEQVWLKVSGHTFREFYAVPEVHLRTQLEGNPLCSV